MKNTWVVVADSSRARIFMAKNATGELDEIETLANPEARLHEIDMTSDLPGRTFDSAGKGRHILEKNTEPKQQKIVDFAKQIDQLLEKARTKKRFSQLILVAAPAFLGILRNQLSSPTSRLVAYELDKNLTQLSSDDIRKHLPERLPKLPM